MKSLWILISVVLLFSCREDKAPVTNKADAVMRVKTRPVFRMEMVDTVWIYGDVRLRWEAQLASQFDGRITEFRLLIGDRVKKGQQIGVIVPPAREALLQIRDQMDPKVRPLLERQIKSIALFSPINGIVLDMWHHNGDVVQKGEQIVHIGDLHVLDVHGELPVRYLPVIEGRKNISVAFVDFPHQPMSLRIEAVSGKIDERKQTVAIRCRLDNRNRIFRPGLRVRMYFPGERHENALVIPRSALLEEEGVFSAFVAEEEHARKRGVEVGIMGDDRVEVLSGLTEGEQVITDKAYSLTDGMKVITE